MRGTKRLRMWLRALAARRSVEAELADEFRFHLEMETERGVRAGLSRTEAERRARLAFGGVERHKEAMRDGRGVRALERVGQDLRLALRRLARTPGFTAAAVLALALGIGLATAVFTVADAMLLRRLPVVEQERLVVLSGRMRDGSIDDYPLGFEGARDHAGGMRSLERVAYYGYEGAAPQTVREDGQATRLQRALVSGEFFDVLGARAVLGRALGPADDVRGAAPVLVLSHRAWQERYAGDAGVLGRRVALHESGITYTVVGVMPPGLDFPRGVDAWATILPSTPEEILPLMAHHLLGRLARGAMPAAARDEMSAYLQRADAPEWQRGLEGTVRTLPELMLGDTRPAVLAFAAASALLLLITCINVANLLLVRGLARLREIAVRAALGAGRGRVTAQLLTENVLLAAAGGALGLAVAAVAVRVFVTFAPADLPRLDEIQLSGGALAGAVGITAAATLLFGVLPAVATSRVAPQEVLRSGSRQSASRGSRRATEALVVLQVALALLVLSAAGLIGRSLVALERAELAFDPQRLLVVELALEVDRYADAASQVAMLDQLLPTLRALPGVRAVAPVVAVPFAGTHGWDGRPRAEGQSVEDAAANPMLNMEVVTADYLATIGAPVLQGRNFTDADREGAPPAILLSESAARHYWPGEDPIGKRLVMGPDGRMNTVVGVVPDTRYRELRDARPSIYFPLAQSFFPFVPTNLVIRAERDPVPLVPALRRALEAHAPGVTLAHAASFDAYLDGPLAQPRLNALLLAVFAAAAVVLASIGLFGVLATMVRQRTREFGVRLALGATGGDVSRLVLRRGLALACAGTAVGLLGALAANRLLAALLFEVSPTDALTLAALAAALLVVAGLASALPARASTRIEPVVALRAD